MRSGGGGEGGAALTESRCLLSVALFAQVHLPAAALLPLERVAEAQLANASDAVERDQRQQREGSSIAQETALGCR
eukprot:5760342-Prymnesium_polylepis.1